MQTKIKTFWYKNKNKIQEFERLKEKDDHALAVILKQDKKINELKVS